MADSIILATAQTNDATLWTQDNDFEGLPFPVNKNGGITMSSIEKKLKPAYEKPTVVALGGLAQGVGYCAAGSSAADGYCTAGVAAASACTAGTVALAAACTAGGAPHA